ncbi:MAG: polyribonucleotide nucleotidyltransferase [Chloroflexota bacterium]|nr:polyribonucleotide nucleotidyltransferase [Chloroflexota bacterium]
MSQVLQCSVAGRALSIETGKLAQQAGGAVVVRYGNTVVLATACAGREPLERIGFVPLTVDYEERLYAAGKIPGSFFRREGRPGEAAILTSRLIDRSLRPLLSKEFNHETQVVVAVLSADKENDPDVCALIAASAALTLSEIPFSGPISVVHVGYMNEKLTLNPTLLQMESSLFDVIVASTKDAIVMVEAGAREVSESLISEAIKFGHESNQEVIELQEELSQFKTKPEAETKSREIAPELLLQVASLLDEELGEVLAQRGKQQRDQALNSLKDKVKQRLSGSFSEDEIVFAFESQFKAKIREGILQKRQHIDGRLLGEVRNITSEVALLPCTHGSALFTRGETQVLSVTTLGSSREEQSLDGIGLEESKRFMHHYNFPPFSTGEVKRIGSPGRREIGHGALVERALAPVLPPEADFPYTIRLVSEVVSSHGSTSMASVCASSLSLMDAGVPIKRPVSGIAMGLVTGEGGEHVILTDIEGAEDAYGDMDFKVAGTHQGITALQLDTKLKGLDKGILVEALEQARVARLEILGKMTQTIGASRPELSPYAPRMHEITIDSSKIGSVIGPGGKTIRAIIDKTKATIDVRNDGTVLIGSPDEEAAQKAIRMIEDLTREIKMGEIYTGKVTRLLNFGAMVEVLPGKEGLVHISELADYRVGKVEDVVKVGDEMMVKVIEIDSLGRINLSHKAVFEDFSRLPGAKARNNVDSKYRGRKEPRRFTHTHNS